MRALPLLVFSLVAVCPAAPVLHGQTRRAITEHDLLRLRWVADPQISPDGRQVAYVLVTSNGKDDRYEASIWTVGTDGTAPRRLTRGPDDVAPRWSPDGGTLAYLRSADKKSPQLWLLPLGGGEPRRLTDLAKGASAAVWSPDGKRIAFTSTTLPGDTPDDTARKSDVRIITRAEFRQDGSGWDDPRRARKIWLAQVDSAGDDPAGARPLTSGPYDEEELGVERGWLAHPLHLRPHARALLRRPRRQRLRRLCRRGRAGHGRGHRRRRSTARWPRLTGRSLAFTGFVNPRRRQSSTQAELFVWQDGQARSLTADYDFDVGDVILGDQRPPRGGSGSSPIVWMADGSSVITLTSEHGRSNLMRFEVASGRREPVTTGNHEIAAYTATPDGSRFALTRSDPTHPLELFLLDTGTRQLTRLTAHNDSLLAELALAEPEELWYRSFDGRRIHAWVYRPPAFKPDGSSPFILNIHGGPHLAYGWSFFHEFQLMAARGYVMLAPNPRGSTSYGQAFANSIQYAFPGDDYRDLMAGVDTLVKRSWVDPKKLGVTGGSGGGILTNWTITRTDRFAAAVAQRSIGDWSGFWYTADFTLFRPSWFRLDAVPEPRGVPGPFAGALRRTDQDAAHADRGRGRSPDTVGTGR